jgi:hypothetical protein
VVASSSDGIGDVSSREQAEAATGEYEDAANPEVWRAVGRRLMTSAEFLWEPLELLLRVRSGTAKRRSIL